MARSAPGQLSLFDDDVPLPPVTPPLALVPPSPPPPPPPHDPADNPVFFAIVASGKAAGEIVAAGNAQLRAHGIETAMRPTETLHVSVLGVARFGDLDNDTLARVRRAGDAVTMPRFEIGFDEAVTFGRGSKPKPFVLPCREGAAELEALADLLRSGLRERGLVLRPRRHAYHLTLAYDRRIIPPTPLEQPIRLPVREVHLVRSLRGEGRYETLGKWPLAG